MNNNGYIFLDFDGVINRCDREGWTITDTKSRLEPGLVANVAGVVEATGASVVLSTTWREQVSFRKLQKLLHDHGLDQNHVVGVTPVLPDSIGRGAEIAMWLDRTIIRPVRFVVLDDNDQDRFNMDPVRRHFVQTNPENGFREWDAIRAQALLTTGPLWTQEVQLIAAG